jgi:hypothetical protein
VSRHPLHFVVACLAAIVASRPLPAATLTQDGDVYTLENAAMRIEVGAAAGARIRSWVLKPSGRDLIALWNGAGEIGGALDDRVFFTGARYSAAIMNPGPEVAELRLECRHESGLNIVKRMSLSGDSPALRVVYELANGTQASQVLFIRNFFLPGNKPQTKDHLYWVHSDPAVMGSPDAQEYYRPAQPEYAALWDKGTGDGIVVYAPGAERFYFWRGSAEFPTFEWLYPTLPAGQVLRAEVVLVAVSEQTKMPDWAALVAANAGDVEQASVSALSGWVDEATKFGVSDTERRRGLWLSIGAESGKQRLPDVLPVDLPLDSDRYIAVTLNALKDFDAPLKVDVPTEFRRYVEPLWETPGDKRRELLRVPSEPVAVAAGCSRNLWLRVRSGAAPKQVRIPITLTLGDVVLPISLALHVWPVKVEAKRPFHVRGYSNGLPVWAGGYEVTDESLRRLEAILPVYAEIGGDVLEWEVAWDYVVAHTRLADTGKMLIDVARNTPERIDLANLPRLDFSYYDPWWDLCRRHGVTWFDTYLPSPAGEGMEERLLSPTVGAGRVKPGTPDARRVVAWFYGEFKRYLEGKGFEGFFCKISDEISPESIPAYIDTAKTARQAGWRPFTTITGMIARTPADINAMNPYCDEWQLNFSLKDDFLALLKTKFELAQERFDLDGPWYPYSNGGARETWSIKAFGENSATGIPPELVDTFQLLEDGEPLATSGGSPWGNTHRGMVFTAGTLNETLYFSPKDGANPTTHRHELRVTVRRESPNGKPLAAIDPADEVWCYGGGSHPYEGAYHEAWCYPIMTLYHGFKGYGLWAFYHWNETERIIWLDEKTHRVTVSPAYCGYRDGWRDALLLSQLQAQRGREALSKIIGSGSDAPLQVG